MLTLFLFIILEGKTDYYARKRLVAQDKNKYNSPKYRLVVRITAQYVICQIVCAKIEGDETLAHASSKDLKKYGLTVGLTNYAAAYCTGLLVARRLLTNLGIANEFEGIAQPDGIVHTTENNGRTYYVPEITGSRRPFRALLDVGISRTTTGARLFAAMKGASDGGLDIPHSERRFPGYDAESKNYNPEVMKQHIFGEHVADYMRHLQENDSQLYEKQFSQYIKAGIGPDDIESLYKRVHDAIRADPSSKSKDESKNYKNANFRRSQKISGAQRRARVAQKLANRAKAEAEEEE